jgi:hypothetical protein
MAKNIQHKLSILLFYMLLFFFGSITYAQNDTIILKNGDRLIGEIKTMKQAVLTIETEYSDSDFKVEWVNISKLRSTRHFLVRLKDGTRMNSVFKKDLKNPDKIIMYDGETEIDASIKDIVYIQALKDQFFSRFNTSLSLGYNYTKSSSLEQITIKSNIVYNSTYWKFTNDFDLVYNSQDDTKDIQHIDGSIGGSYYLNDNWFTGLSVQFLSNEEQKLELRTTVMPGMGKYFFYTGRMYFSGVAGLAWNNEKFNDTLNTNRNSLEAFMYLELNLFDFGDLSLVTNITAYPSLTESNRIRTGFNFDLKYDLPFNFFIKGSYTHNYDNKPVMGASTSDYLIQTTFGWEVK